MNHSFKNQDSVLGDYVLQLQRQKEERERKRREHEEEIERQRKADEARKIAEEERLRREAEERKRAKERELRAEQEAIIREHRRKVTIKVGLILLAIILVVVAGVKIVGVIRERRAIKEANELIQKGDELISVFRFGEARELYETAYQKTENDDVRRKVREKNNELETVRNTAYNLALRRLKILLDADDNVFNQYSSECLNKMIEIDSDRKETIYYRNIRPTSLAELPDYERLGDRSYGNAQYEKAAKQYQAAQLVLEMDSKTISAQLKEKIGKAERCSSLLEQATKAEENKCYKEAEDAYTELLKLHPISTHERSKARISNLKLQYDKIQSKTIADLIIEEGETEIKAERYRNHKKLKSVIIPNSVTKIGTMAFNNCENLTSVTFPNSVTNTGYCIFLDCKNLKTPIYNSHIFVYLPTSHTGTYTIPNGIKKISGGAFCMCKKVTSITIPNSVTSIGSYAFSNCWSLTSLTIPKSVTDIGDQPFHNCSMDLKLPEKFRGKVDVKYCKSVTYY